MIPKVIHYCWFGGNPLPELAQKCIASWRKYCPDYEIKEWNETNFDISGMDYVREAYEEKAWAFVSDVARLQIIYEQGGIYLDTDVEMIRSFDDLLSGHAFMGIEDGRAVNTGLGFGAEAGYPLIKELLEDYRGRHFYKEDGTLDRTPCTLLQTPILVKNGFVEGDMMQEVCGAKIYPSEYFCPKSYQTGRLCVTENTYSIHYFESSPLNESEKKYIDFRHDCFRKYGVLAMPIWTCFRIVYKTKRQGLLKTMQLGIQKLKASNGFL